MEDRAEVWSKVDGRKRRVWNRIERLLLPNTVFFQLISSTLPWPGKTKMTFGSVIDLLICTRIHGRDASIISFSFWDSISQTQVQAFFNFKIEPNNFLNTNMFKLKQHEYVLELVTKRTFGEPIPTCRTVSHSGEHLSNRFLVINKSFFNLEWN